MQILNGILMVSRRISAEKREILQNFVEDLSKTSGEMALSIAQLPALEQSLTVFKLRSNEKEFSE